MQTNLTPSDRVIYTGRIYAVLKINKDGTITIRSDFDGEGMTVPISEVRLYEKVFRLQPMPTYVIISKDTGQAVLETDNPKLIASINTEKYYVLEIRKYLEGLSKELNNETI